MNKLKYMASVAIAAMAISSCTEDTEEIGHSLTSEADRLDFSNAIFYAKSNTYVADSVMTRQSYTYLGRVIDPETQTEVSSCFTTQFYLLPNITIPTKYITSKENNEIIADSCDIIMYLTDSFYSKDNLAATQMNVRELDSPVEEDMRYYSNFDHTPFIRKDGKGVDVKHMFTYTNQTDASSDRAKSTYLNNIRIPLNMAYVSKTGQSYKNYGTYILRKLIEYQDNGHSTLPNTWVFTHNICPGMAFDVTDGYGFHAAFTDIGLRIYYNVTRPDTAYKAALILSATPEIMQTITVKNDRQALKALAAETGHTYLKSPAGLFTEVKFPVDELWKNHENDSLIGAKITFQRMNNKQDDERSFSQPTSIMMVMKDSLKTFFEKSKVPDGRTSYYTSFNSTYNTYSFSNISNLLTRLWKMKKKYAAQDPTWNDPESDHYKVMLIPVSYGTSSTSSSSISWMGHDLSLSSTRLVGGDTPIELNVVYAKFKK